MTRLSLLIFQRYRWMIRFVLISAFCILITTIILQTFLNGSRLAQHIANAINNNIRGTISVESVQWPAHQLLKGLLGGDVKVTLRNVTVFDPDNEQIIDAPLVVAHIAPYHIITGYWAFVFSDVHVTGGWVKIRYKDWTCETCTEPTTDATIVSTFSTKPSSKKTLQHADTETGPPIFELKKMSAEGVTVDIKDENSHVILKHTSSHGWLYYDGRHKDDLFAFVLEDGVSSSGSFTLFDLPTIPLDVTKIQYFKQESDQSDDYTEHVAHNLTWNGNIQTAWGPFIQLKGGLFDYWTNPNGGYYDTVFDIQNASPITEKITNNVINGDELDLTIKITANKDTPLYGFSLKNAIVNLSNHNKKTFVFDSAELSLNSETKSGKLEGHLSNKEIIGLKYDWNNSPQTNFTILRPINVSVLLNDAITEIVGGNTLAGSFALDFENKFNIKNLNLKLGQTIFNGGLSYSNHKLYPHNLSAKQNNTLVRTINKSNYLDLTSYTQEGIIECPLNLSLSIWSNKLSKWLTQYNVPTISEKAQGKVYINGTLKNPTVKTNVVLNDVPILGQTHATLLYRNKIVTIVEAISKPLHGLIQTEGSIQLNQKTSAFNIQSDGIDLELSKIPGIGNFLHGIGNFTVTLTNNGDNSIEASATAYVPEMSLWGETYKNLTLTGAKKDTNINLKASANTNDNESLEIISQFNLGDTPQASIQSKSKKNTLPMNFVLNEIEKDILSIQGSLLDNKIFFKSIFELNPTFHSNNSITFKNIPLEKIWPDWSNEYNVKGTVSGKIEHLILSSQDAFSFTLRISDLNIQKDFELSNQKNNPLHLKNDKEILVVFKNGQANLVEPIRLTSATGQLSIAGFWGEQVELTLQGDIDLNAFLPLTDRFFSKLEGTIGFDFSITGNKNNIIWNGKSSFKNIAAHGSDNNALISFPSTEIIINNNLIVINQHRINVQDTVTKTTYPLNISGNVNLSNSQFQSELFIQGQFSGKLATFLFSDDINEGHGHVPVDIKLIKTKKNTLLYGSIVFQDNDSIELNSNHLQRTISFNTGKANFNGQTLTLSNVQGAINKTGVLKDLTGTMLFQQWDLTSIDLSLSALNVTLDKTNTFTFNVNIPALRITGKNLINKTPSLALTGKINILHGRYTQPYNIVLEALQSDTSFVAYDSVYKNNPILKNMTLNLSINAGNDLSVDNNLAQISLGGNVTLTDKLFSPKIDGEIFINQGKFSFTGIRSEFTRINGDIYFSKLQSFPEKTPIINVTGESDFIDGHGQLHVVVLELTGTLKNLNINLFTKNTNLNKTETIVLITSGTHEQRERRERFYDISTENNFNRLFDRTTATPQEGNFGTLEQVTKDIAGDILSLYLTDPISNSIGIDILRIELGTTAHIYAQKKLSNKTTLTSELERTFQGYTISVRGEHKLGESFSLESEYLAREFTEDIGRDINSLRFKFSIHSISQ